MINTLQDQDTELDLINIRAKDIIESITLDDVKKFLESLGVDQIAVYPDKEYLVCPTICHNPIDEAESMKLYWYQNNKIFKCYTECNETMSIFTLYQKFMEINYHHKVSFYEAEDYIKKQYNSNNINNFVQCIWYCISGNRFEDAEIELLLKQPSINNELEIRDLAILTLMYDSGARVQEIIDLHVYSLKFSNNYSIYLTGKGSKTRIVPIQKATAQILKKYISYNNLLKDDILFYNKYHQPLSQKGMTYILNKYLKRAKNENPNYFNNNISLHSLRHSKAMHLLEAGVNIVYIRDFLGHVSISTTEIYAKANPEIRRREIEKSTANIIKNSKFSKSKQIELMDYLKNLRRFL